jgi:hypothetical protein
MLPPLRSGSTSSAALVDGMSALAARQATEAAAATAELQHSMSMISCGAGVGCAPPAAFAAAEAAATAAATPPLAAATPAGTSAGAAAMLNINVCSTALATLAPRVADLATLNSEFAYIMDQTDDSLLEAQCVEGAAAVNACKNRYVNVLPYDANRVPLDAAAAAAATAAAAAPGGCAGAALQPPPPRAPGKAPRMLFEGTPRHGIDSSSYFNGSFIRVRRALDVACVMREAGQARDPAG